MSCTEESVSPQVQNENNATEYPERVAERDKATMRQQQHVPPAMAVSFRIQSVSKRGYGLYRYARIPAQKASVGQAVDSAYGNVERIRPAMAPAGTSGHGWTDSIGGEAKNATTSCALKQGTWSPIRANVLMQRARCSMWACVFARLSHFGNGSLRDPKGSLLTDNESGVQGHYSGHASR
ncbi:hypothetical protein LMG33810_002714 [Carnimonas sp. LMG 33810]